MSPRYIQETLASMSDIEEGEIPESLLQRVTDVRSLPDLFTDQTGSMTADESERLFDDLNNQFHGNRDVVLRVSQGQGSIKTNETYFDAEFGGVIVRREKPEIKEVTTKEMLKVRAHCSKDVAPTVKPTTVVRNFKGKVQRDNFEMDGMATFIESNIDFDFSAYVSESYVAIDYVQLLIKRINRDPQIMDDKSSDESSDDDAEPLQGNQSPQNNDKSSSFVSVQPAGHSCAFRHGKSSDESSDDDAEPLQGNQSPQNNDKSSSCVPDQPVGHSYASRHDKSSDESSDDNAQTLHTNHSLQNNLNKTSSSSLVSLHPVASADDTVSSEKLLLQENNLILPLDNDDDTEIMFDNEISGKAVIPNSSTLDSEIIDPSLMPILHDIFPDNENVVTLELPVHNHIDQQQNIEVNNDQENNQHLENDNNLENNNNNLERNNNPMQEGNAAAKKVTRKRTRNPSQHKAAIAKRALYSGEAHLNRKGQLRPAPTMRLPCACKMGCRFKITEEERSAIFHIYTTSLGCKDKQWAYIRAHSTSARVTKSTTNNATPQRKVSRKYFFDVTTDGRDKIVPVCKVMFMNTLAIWDGVIDSAWSHINPETKTPTPDKRGKHGKRPKKITEAQKETVRNHINSYPRIPSHYVRSRIKREYVDAS
ncbi:Halomucin [Frankliniella fusca]|uniref:Halomucin n=1 Tax=Frankliniella fusca TaxID=407009 RepID=A0AAE1HV94_9NEOP|nr:Halomucin [Frankliniella fusca]